jgi:O-antigen biosynthesis protein
MHGPVQSSSVRQDLLQRDMAALMREFRALEAKVSDIEARLDGLEAHLAAQRAATRSRSFRRLAIRLGTQAAQTVLWWVSKRRLEDTPIPLRTRGWPKWDQWRMPTEAAWSGRGIVFVAAHFPPLYDQHSGGQRLKKLIDLIGSMGWTIIFGSITPMLNLPGLLSAKKHRIRYEAALRQAGVVHFAYGMAEIEEVLANLGMHLRYAFLSFPDVAHALLPPVRQHCPCARVIYDMVDFHALRMMRQANLCNDDALRAAAERQKAVELALVQAADVTVAITSEERAAILDQLPNAVIDVIPNMFDIPRRDLPSAERRRGVLFVGNFWHAPNADAVKWFVERIWPIVLDEIPDACFRIAGPNPDREILALGKKRGVQVLGYVPDLVELFDSSRVFVAPLRYGAGMKGKVGQSLAFGLPVVSTSVGAEGMDLLDGVNALIPDEEALFAQAIIRLSRDDALWSELQERGLDLVKRTLSIDSVRGKVEQLFHA